MDFSGVGAANTEIQSVNIAITNTVVDPSWYPDSGATSHCTMTDTTLTQKQQYQGAEKVHMGDGMGLQIQNTDTFSRYTWVFLLHTKSEAIQTFITFKNQVENEFDTNIKVVQSDWGGEYHPLESYCIQHDNSLFVQHTQGFTIFLIVYVDDILLIGSSNAAVLGLIQKLNAVFALKDLGEVDYFLGIQVQHTTNGMHLGQRKYIIDLLAHADMQHVNPLPTPMAEGEKITTFGSDPLPEPYKYRSIVGALQYVTITRPEISYVVNKVSQFMHTPMKSHWKIVKKILRYLKGNLDFGLTLTKASTMRLTGFSDADWASDPDDRRSTSGFCIYLGDNLIYWASRKQKTVSRSSTEAEYRSLTNATVEVIWIQSLLSELRVHTHVLPTIWCDNQSTILMLANLVLHA
ncbi:uncharacterized mitochondrial protein AtMg00810-like [Humulus lupulus]|uniref:uncharacterized mitochondrial protein AtMg00810-like n=1 Tax=Humulus lupulus TaxID=3486 RepID=UPI002B407DB7|nr:uncharacterized mitochondrial protein AtMg00810-like [Humulus lupulus]